MPAVSTGAAPEPRAALVAGDALLAATPTEAGALPGAGSSSCAAAPPLGPYPEEVEVARFEAAKKSASVGSATSVVGALLLANTLLGGTGMLGIPHAFAVAGYAVGTLCVLCSACCSAFGSHLLALSARRIGQAPCSFYTVAGAVAPRWTWLIDGAVTVKCFGVATSYLMIVGDLAPDALRYFGAGDVSRRACVAGAFVVGGSLTCLRNLSALRHTAAASLAIVLWTVLLLALFVACPGPTFDPCAGQESWEIAAGLGRKAECNNLDLDVVSGQGVLHILKALPVFIFSFTCQQNVFPVCNEVKNVTRSRINNTIGVAYAFATTAFLGAAFFGYCTYGNQVESDVLKGYPRKWPVEATRLLYSLLVVFSFPLQVHPSRSSALSLWSMVAGPAEGFRRFWIVTAVLLTLSLAIALSLEELGIILAIVGATGSTAVSYILPGLIYTQAFPERHVKRVFAKLQLGVGCVIMPVCLALIFLV